jgi:type IV secretory pathway VirB10-like protein
MSDPKKPGPQDPAGGNRILGSLRDALMAAGRTETPADQATERKATPAPAAPTSMPAAVAAPVPPAPPAAAKPELPAAADAARAAAAQTMRIRGGAAPAARTQLLRGRVEVARTEFHQDPVVGWLVVVGGPGLGAFRPIYEGNNSMGRSKSQRIPIDFGDDTISSEEQGYLRYDSADRSFLFVPNMSKTNVVSVNSKKPTAAVPLSAMDVITMGRTQLAFIPFCGEDFDWSELGDVK